MRDWLMLEDCTFPPILFGLAILLGAAGLMMVLVAQLMPEPTCRLQERIDYCNMVWGDSKHFATCMRGERVIPSSGR